MSGFDQEELEDAFDNDLSEDTFAIGGCDCFSGLLRSQRRFGHLGIWRRGEWSWGDETVRRWHLGCGGVFARGKQERRVEELIGGCRLEELNESRNDSLPSFW